MRAKAVLQVVLKIEVRPKKSQSDMLQSEREMETSQETETENRYFDYLTNREETFQGSASVEETEEYK